MDEHVVILIIALIVLFYGFISKKFAQFDISGPMVFTVLGLICSPFGLGITAVEVDAEFVTVLVEITLVLVLFSDAALLDLKLLRRSWHIPARLLFIALPLTIFAGTAAAVWLFPDQAIIYMILLALLLTPTDAALGKAVVSDPKVPNMIRSSINVESGLNDGIVFPVVLTVVALITSGLSKADDYNWIWYVAEQIVFGMLVGGMVGYLGAKLLNKAIAHNWIEESYQNLIPIALAILGFYLAEALLGNGFIAAFFAGLYIGNTSKQARAHIAEFAESEGELFILISFFLFGLAFVPLTLHDISVNVVIYALLSLTVLRMLPVMISLIGTNLDFASRVFIAWFGPRGIASILYVLIVAHNVGDIGGFDVVYAVVTLTILMSIFAHGFTAQPFSNLYGKSHCNRS